MTTHQHSLDRLESQLREFRIEFEKFFNGALATAPEELREQIRDRLRALRSSHISSFADRFRLTTLEARFNSTSELINRRLRVRERVGGTGLSAPRAAPSPDPYKGIEVDLMPKPEAVKALYDELYSGQGAGKKTDFTVFQGYLEKQTAKIRDRTGCASVQYRVVSDQGKLKLKARPLGTPSD